MAEMGALRVLMDWRALEHIPQDGSISYADLAAKVDAEEPLLRKCCISLNAIARGPCAYANFSLTGRFASMIVSTGVLRQIGEDHVAHTKLSPIYANNVPQGMFFQIMYVPGACLVTAQMLTIT